MVKQSLTSLAICLALTGCDTMNAEMDSLSSNLQKYNDFMSGKSTQMASKTMAPNKNWGVTDSQALAYLTKDTGKLQEKNVDWFKFWSFQAHYNTSLYKKADKYCTVADGDSREVGSNCSVFFNAVVAANANKQVTQNFG